MRYFNQEGNVYRIKRNYVLEIIVSTILIALAVAGLITPLTALAWIFGPFAVLYLLAVSLRRVEIDMNQKALIVKSGIFNPLVQIPFTDFLTFELMKMSQYFITTNTALNLRYAKNGKEKVVGIAQGLTSRAMQNILNEIDEIIGIDGNQR